MLINVDKLREDLKEELMGTAFGGGFGGALIQAIDVDRYSDEEVIKQAIANGINLSKYTDD